jgi:cytidylate kinase
MTAIAIDGPAGAGKSTVARRAAEELGFLYVDTGALYRAISLFMLEKGADPGDSYAVIPLLKEISVSLKYENGEQRVFLGGRDVSDRIRSDEVSMAASRVSAIPEVRSFLLSLQRDLAKTHNVIMDGRDIGTVVLPDAQVKIFLTASAEARAKRRYLQLVRQGMKANYEDVLEDLKQRDYNDSHRAVAPLKAAEDAVLVDTTGDTLEQSVARLIQIVKSKIRGEIS